MHLQLQASVFVVVVESVQILKIKFYFIKLLFITPWSHTHLLEFEAYICCLDFDRRKNEAMKHDTDTSLNA